LNSFFGLIHLFPNGIAGRYGYKPNFEELAPYFVLESQILKQRSLKLEGEIEKVNEEHRAARREHERVFAELNKKASSLCVQKEMLEQMTTETHSWVNDLETQLKVNFSAKIISL